MKRLSALRPAMIVSILALLVGWQLSVTGQAPVPAQGAAPSSIPGPPQLPGPQPPFYIGSPPGYSGPPNSLPREPTDLRRLGVAAPAPAQPSHPLNPDWNPTWERVPSSIPGDVLMADPAQLNPRELRLIDRGLEQKTVSLTEQYANAMNDALQKELKSQLTDVVDQHFAVRQSIRDREIAELEKDVAHLRNRLQQREDAKQQITQGRIDQLMRSAKGLGWDGQPAALPSVARDFKELGNPVSTAPAPPTVPLSDERRGGPVARNSSRPVGEVSGVVTFRGQPFMNAAVVLSSPKSGRFGPADIDKDGTYQIASPLPTGTYKFYLVPRRVQVSPSSVPIEPRIPSKYWDESTTDISVTVVEGENSFDLELTR